MTSDLPLRYIPQTYSSSDSDASALRLILELRPEWHASKGQIEFDRFTDGITNTLLKAINKRPNQTKEENNKDAVLLRAYGEGSDLIIDREKEMRCHLLLAQYNLAPALLARFDNGLLYEYIEGRPCKPEDFRQQEVWQAIARRLGEWHARLPIIKISSTSSTNGVNGRLKENDLRPTNGTALVRNPLDLTVGKPVPNVWTVTQKWIDALPTTNSAERERRDSLQNELEWLVQEHANTPGLDNHPLVFAHTDLLSGNVIIQPANRDSVQNGAAPPVSVSFIDYEYAVPAPAGFDIANHFSEWGGFDCDHSLLPTRAQRRDFIEHYVQGYSQFVRKQYDSRDVDTLFAEVDHLRGAPGFYWGVWGLVQATISQIDFDYAAYAEIRLGEYHAWKAENDGSRKQKGELQSIREKRWAQE